MSLAMFDMTPANTITKVKSLRGAACTMSRRVVPIRPLFSATPMPSMATSTVPRGAKPVKLEIVCSRIQCSPSLDTRLMMSIEASSIGLTASSPSLLNSQDRRISPKAKMAKSVAGCGSALPTLSIAVRNRERIEVRGTDFSLSFIGGMTS